VLLSYLLLVGGALHLYTDAAEGFLGQLLSLVGKGGDWFQCCLSVVGWRLIQIRLTD
jgi:hypothetical protein